MPTLLFCCAVVLVASVAAHLKVGNATSPRTNGTTNATVAIKNTTSNAEATTTTTTTISRTNVTKKNSTTTHRSIGNATETKTNLTKKNSTTTHRNTGNATAPRTNLTKKNSTIMIANTTSTTVTTTTTTFVFPSSQLPHTCTAEKMPMVIDVPVSPAALVSGVHVVSDWWMKRPKDIEIKLLGSSSGSSSPSILASVSTVYPASLTICGPNGDLPCNYPVTPTSTHKVSINSSDLVSTVRVSLLSPLNIAGTPNDDVIIQEVVVVIPGQTSSPAPPSGNVLLEMFAGGVNCGHVPTLNALTKVQSVQLADINIPLSNNYNPKIYGWQTGNNWVASFTATLLVSAGGFYKFSISLGNADTAELWVNGQRIIQSGCSWGLGATGGLKLTPGTHSILLWYADDGWNDRVILSYQGSDTGGSSIVVPSSRFVVPITSTTSTTSTNTTTTTATQAIATIRVVIAVADPTAFNLSAYVATLAAAAPTAASVASTVVEGFRVTTSYTFTETITASNAQAAIAIANNVATSQVQVTVTFVAGIGPNRRLQGQPNYTVKANITVPEASKAKAVQSTAASPAALSSALQQVGVIHNFAPVVAAAPVATVNVKTVLPAAQSNAVMASPTALQNAAAQANGLGITVVQYVAPPTTTTTTATSSFLGTAAIGANSTTLRGSTTKYIAVSASCRVPTCWPLFQILAIWAVAARLL